jgi:xanthine dehydrogenase small subunit
VTPASRVAGREVTTLDGLDDSVRERWAQAFCQTGASQCGFCTPGIIMRLAATAARADGGADRPLGRDEIERALVAHLCRCTGWRTIVEAALVASGPVACAPSVRRDWDAAARRASLEGRAPQRVGPQVALGEGGFAEDLAPAGALVAIPDGAGGWAVGDSLAEARSVAGKVQGRRTTVALVPPLSTPPGDWVLTLRTAWVEPAYLETDASWCYPGGVPSSPLANGGAFGAKRTSIAPRAARDLADRYGRPVRVVFAREDVVRWGPKRPPVAAGVNGDGTGVMRVVATPGIAEAIRRAAPTLRVEEVKVAGPPTSIDIRGAGWVEAAVLLAALDWLRHGHAPRICSPDGAVASAEVTDAGVRVEVSCGPVLDEVVLRSYAIGAAHQALGWVRTEGVAVDDAGVPQDLTVRSFGVLQARETPHIEVYVREDGRTSEPVNGSDAVFAAVAAAAWIEGGLTPERPTDRRRST